MKGPYPNHAAAMAQATGYDSPLVSQKVEEATRAVLEGRAGYERDGTAFATRPKLTIYEVLQPLIREGSTIADFGGGLGGLFFNAPELFPPSCRKLVIEQASMVEAGRRLARDHQLPLEFLTSEALDIPAVDVLVVSGVLQFLEDPWDCVRLLLHQANPAAVIIDRTAVGAGPSRWHVQTNPGYYNEEVSYPVQVLNRQQLLEAFPGFRLVRRWHNSFDPGRPEHIGMLLLRDDAEGSKG
ncbi:MAG: methyltransferase, TIGR04325 family [Cyanobacteriota bacterium]|nr:methyltransferase, TIGR04325 family [Cyanobacteriota bacterium]